MAFDVKSLFTSIPLQLPLDCTENAIELPLPTDDILDLLNLCLTSTYFQYNGKHNKQLHGSRNCHAKHRGTSPSYTHLFQLRLLPWTMFHGLQCTMVNPFVAEKFSLVHVHWNNGDHLCEGVQDSFQLKWLRKFLSMSELKNFIFKISQ